MTKYDLNWIKFILLESNIYSLKEKLKLGKGQ